MDLISFLSLSTIAVVALWFWPLPTIREFRKVNRTRTSELEALTALLAAVHSARSFDEVWAEFRSPLTFSPATLSRLDRTAEQIKMHGLSPTLMLQQVVSEATIQNRLKHKWQEGIAPAVTAALLLAVMPLPLLLSATAGALDVWGWMFTHPIGRWLTLLGAGLVALSAWLLRHANPFRVRKSRASFALSSNLAAIVAGIAVFSFWPGFFGGLLALLVGLLVRSFWNQLRSTKSQELELELVRVRPRVVNLLATAVTAGASWDRAVELAAAEVPSAAAADWRDINQRIKWGVPVPQAFSEGAGYWQQIAVVVDQTLRTGAPLTGALFSLASYWQEAGFSEQVNLLERKASRMIVLVTLLQLPAFILIGLVPLVAASLTPLFDLFLSTSL